jgi:hypothetical protein
MQGHADYYRLGENPETCTLTASGKTLIAGANTAGHSFHSLSQRSKARTCEVCDGPVENKRINRDLHDETGMTVCKACIDEALCLICSKPPLARLIARIVTEQNHG